MHRKLPCTGDKLAFRLGGLPEATRVLGALRPAMFERPSPLRVKCQRLEQQNEGHSCTCDERAAVRSDLPDMKYTQDPTGKRIAFAVWTLFRAFAGGV